MNIRLIVIYRRFTLLGGYQHSLHEYILLAYLLGREFIVLKRGLDLMTYTKKLGCRDLTCSACHELSTLLNQQSRTVLRSSTASQAIFEVGVAIQHWLVASCF